MVILFFWNGRLLQEKKEKVMNRSSDIREKKIRRISSVEPALFLRYSSSSPWSTDNKETITRIGASRIGG
ncbi:MAG TPA: hypothetical protein PK154_10310, partial [Methanoregulaceae archaeon]|nr:hypothetical protein [Methanoregulaceae archaeon]